MNRRGFTLLEFMISLGLVMLLSGAVYSFLAQLGTGREVLSTSVEDAYSGCAIIERIEADAQTALAGGGRIGGGVVGTRTSLRLLTRAVWLGEGEASDLQGCEFVFDHGASTVRARRWAGAGAQGEFETVSGRVRELRFRYHDGRRWLESFDSGRVGFLPVAIEISIWPGIAPPPEEEARMAEAMPEDVDVFAAEDGGEEGERWPPSGSEREQDGPQQPPQRWRLISIPDGGPGTSP